MAGNKKRFSGIINTVKVVLPGIIVSLIGGTAGVLLFNNPEKIKGRATQAAWHAVIQYEKIYDNNIISTARYASTETIAGLKQYKDDLMHQIQMLTENYRNIKEESNIDSRLLAIINCKTDTYNQVHRLTDVYLDSMVKLAENPAYYIPEEKTDTDSSYNSKLLAASLEIMNAYNRRRMHLIDRDSSTISNILEQLTQSYSRLLYTFRFTKRLPDEYKRTLQNIIGDWDLLFTGEKLSLNSDHSGTLVSDGYSNKGSWQLDKDYKLVLTTAAGDSAYTFHVLNVSASTIRLAVNDSMHVVGYKQVLRSDE